MPLNIDLSLSLRVNGHYVPCPTNVLPDVLVQNQTVADLDGGGGRNRRLLNLINYMFLFLIPFCMETLC